MSDVEVLYITGTGRSGSTLLANLLGSTKGLFSAGELRFIWDRGFQQSRRCGCSQPFHECEVWQRIVEGAFGDEPPDPVRMQQEVARVTRLRQLPQLLTGRLDDDAIQAAAGYYLENVERLYRAVANETGAMVVDSSKLPTYCFLLHQVPSLRVRVVHLVRDPRATAHSWKRLRATGALEDDDEEMDRFSVWKSAMLWSVWNSTARHLFSNRSDYLQIRYEDLVTNPRAVIEEVRAFAGLPPDDEPFIDDHTVTLVENHAVAGNPNRRRHGQIRLEEDDEWRVALGSVDRATVTALTAPVLGRFGYPLLPGRAPAR
jgi:hypothetical protein